MVTINVANGDGPDGTIGAPIAIGTNDDHRWREWRSPFMVTNRSNEMDPLAPFRGDVTSTIANDGQWDQ